MTIESCKYSHNRDVDNNNMLTTEQKEKRKRLFSKMADAAKDYIEQRLLDENKLNEYTTVQRNYPIGSVDLNRNHSSDVLV